MNLPMVILRPGISHPHGATLAQNYFVAVMPNLTKSREENTLFVLDCDGAESITASFVRGTAFRAFLCGQAEAQGIEATVEDITPLRLFPVVTGCSPETRDAVHEFFRGRKVPILEIFFRGGKMLAGARLLGKLDPVLRRTLLSLAGSGEATAGDLAERSEESISINGWNNRLADLFLLRLVTRRREGKFWVYAALLKEIELWD